MAASNKATVTHGLSSLVTSNALIGVAACLVANLVTISTSNEWVKVENSLVVAFLVSANSATLQPGRIAKPVEWAMRRELLSPATPLAGLS